LTQPAGGGEYVTIHPRGSVIAVVVLPRSARNQIEEYQDGALRVRVTAPPVDGAANAAILKLLAEAIGLPRSRLEIIAGERGRRKRILVSGLTPEAVTHRLQMAIGAADR
jgi:uncharacterized protein (TIGR00251 family)